MTLVKIADQWFRIATAHPDGGVGGVVAQAYRGETGDRVGLEFSGATEAEAIANLTRWIEWQSAHASALLRLQEAERHYHRSVTSGAFVSTDDERAVCEHRASALRDVEAARLVLDAVRTRRPE